jgi:hypothetical protein
MVVVKDKKEASEKLRDVNLFAAKFGRVKYKKDRNEFDFKIELELLHDGHILELAIFTEGTDKNDSAKIGKAFSEINNSSYAYLILPGLDDIDNLNVRVMKYE